MKLVELVLTKTTAAPGAGVELVDGLYLWTLRNCDMVIVDDVDLGLRGQGHDDEPVANHLISPDQLRQALTTRRQAAPLAWLGKRRSAWVIGNEAERDAWRRAIASLLAIAERDIAIVHVRRPESMPL